MADLIGQRLGQYTLDSVIGKGGMANVYSAVQQPLNRMVAIKVMKNDIMEDEEFTERFEREVKLLVDLEHPHIVPVIDYGNQDGQVYIVMRRIDGGSLHQRLKVMGALSLPMIVKILLHVGSALSFAHQKGIVHRDMKPSNVMLDSTDNAYLTDFGIAKLLQSTTKLTASNTILGTPIYMAPEQWRGEDLDARTDIYALGIMAYEMVTGKPPYDGDTSFTLMYKHFNEMPPPPTQVVSDLPPNLEAVILRAIAKSPDNRFQSAEEFAEAFRRASEGKSVVLPELKSDSPSGATPILNMPFLVEDDKPTQESLQNQTSPYPTATESRNVFSMILIAVLGALFIIVGIGIGVILPSLQKVDPTLAPVSTPAAQASLGGQTMSLSNGVEVMVPVPWQELETTPYLKVGNPTGREELTVIRASLRQVAAAMGLNPLQAQRDSFETLMEKIAIRENFEAGYQLTRLNNFAIPAFHLSGIFRKDNERLYGDYYLFSLGGPDQAEKEILILLSRHIIDAGYQEYQSRALFGLLENLKVDGQRLRERIP